MITCTTCKTEIHPLAVFPNDICLDCHAKNFEMALQRRVSATSPNDAQPKSDEIADMWRSPNLFN